MRDFLGFLGGTTPLRESGALQSGEGAAFVADLATGGFSGVRPGAVFLGFVDSLSRRSPGFLFVFFHNSRVRCAVESSVFSRSGFHGVKTSEDNAGQSMFRAGPIMNHPMHAKFAITYTVFPEHNKRVDTHYSDDPVETELFLSQLIATKCRIHELKHDGVDLEPNAFDRMVRLAGERLIGRLIGAALKIDYAEVRHRFGLAV
jgi:hypothetical protein